MEECKGVQAVVLEQPNVEVNLHTFTKPVLEKGAVLLETIYSEVCGTDCHLFHGKLAGVRLIFLCTSSSWLVPPRYPILSSLAT